MTPTTSILRGGIVLNEVLIDPNGTQNFDTDGNGTANNNDEFVELYNLSSSAIDLGGLQLWDEGRDLWFTFPLGTTLGAGKFAVVVGGIQAGGSLPNLPAGNLAFDAGRGTGIINNGGDNVVLYDPDADEYVQFAFNGAAADDPTADYTGFSTTATRVGAIEDWGNDTDGISRGRTSDGNTNLFSHNDFGSIRLASPGATNLTLTPIHKIQGDGASSPVTGSVFEIEAIVVGDFQGNEELQGFFLQEEDTDADGNPATSEGIFVLHDALDVAVGDKVRLVGEVGERSGQTAIENVSHIEILDSGNPLPNTTTSVTLPFANAIALEAYEGMRVRFPQTLTVTSTENLGQFGEVVLSSRGRLWQPTQIASPGAAANAVATANALDRIIFDDGSTEEYPADLRLLDREFDAASQTLRGGDTATGVAGIVGEMGGEYRVQVTEAIDFARTNSRPATPPAVDGSLQVASFNLNNYFTTFDNGSNGALGADRLTEFTRQRDKIAIALAAIDADIIALTELENNGYGPGSAIANLTDALNELVGAGTYEFVNPGVPMLGSGAIASGFLYKRAVVSEAGTAAFLETPGIFQGENTNTPPLTQTFVVTESGNPSFGEKVTLAVSDFKSKAGTGTGANIDAGDGQGNWNQTRVEGANALTAWLATDPTAAGDSDVLVVGDLNAYAREDPIAAIEGAGYTNLDTTSYSSSNGGAWGTLDYAFANSSLAPQITGVGRWRINADEPAIFDYNEEFQSAAQLNNWYNADPYRAGDRDPMVIGLNLETPISPIPVTNQPPENRLPAIPVTTFANQTLTIPLGIFDPDGGVIPLQVTLTATQGTVTLGETTGLDFLVGDGTEDEILSFLGTTEAIEIALAGLRFTPTIDFVGEASLEITTDDRDTTRPGGAQTDTDLLAIAVTAEVPATPPQPDLEDSGDRPSQTPIDPAIPAIPAIPSVPTVPQFCPHLQNLPPFPTPNPTINTITGNFIEGDDNPNTLDGRSQVRVTVVAWAGNDDILGSPGDDLLFANRDDDRIEAGEGNDWIFGGKGNDAALGGVGNDVLAGDFGDDRLWGDEGGDLLFGNAGNDYTHGGSGSDTIYAGRDDDAAVGGVGDDVLAGDLGNDCVYGETGDDRLFGNFGADVLDGGLDDDRLYGGRDNDTLLGGLGGDVLSGDLGNDWLVGGLGGDRFDFRPGDGRNTIADFTDGVDIIGLREGLTFADLTFAQVGNDTQIAATGLTIVLLGVNTDAIDAADFAHL